MGFQERVKSVDRMAQMFLSTDEQSSCQTANSFIPVCDRETVSRKSGCGGLFGRTQFPTLFLCVCLVTNVGGAIDKQLEQRADHWKQTDSDRETDRVVSERGGTPKTEKCLFLISGAARRREVRCWGEPISWGWILHSCKSDLNWFSVKRVGQW